LPLPTDSQAELDTLLASMDLMTDDDAWFLADQWGLEDAAERKRAWASAKTAIEERGLMKELDRVRGSIGGWMAASKSDFQGVAGLMGSAGSGAGARQSAAPALVDAVAALLAGDGLSDDEAGVLLRPWQALGGEEDEPAKN
jgi:hypothetical protein